MSNLSTGCGIRAWPRKIAGATNQTKIAIGNNVGKPIIEVLNADGSVATRKEGLLEITNTPKHFGNKTGRNPGIHADYIPVSQTSSGGGNGGTAILLGTTGNIKSNVVY